jgi:hypothetical protein
MQTLVMPQGYTGSPIMSRVFIAVEEIQEQLQQVETFLSRKHSQAAAKAATGIISVASAEVAAQNQPARLPVAATSAVLARDAASELQRRREQQQKQQSIQPSHSSVAAPAKLDTGSNQAMQMRALLLKNDGNDSDSSDGAQPFRSASFDTRQQQRGSDPLILAPVSRSALRASASGSKVGSGALISDSDSGDGDGVIVTLQRKSDVPSSPVAKASLSVAASRLSAAAAALSAQAESSSSSGDTDESGESDYEEDFDAESGSNSSRQQPVKVRDAIFVAPISACTRSFS